MVDLRVYPRTMNVAACVEDLQRHFSAQGYETQILGTAPEMLFQVRMRGAVRAVTGMASAMTAQFRKAQDGILVTLGAQEWADKVAVGALGAVVFAPLLVTAAYGVWKQSKLPDQCWRIIDKYGTCPRCGAPNQIGQSKFCSKCGIALV